MYDANDIRTRIPAEARRGDWQTVAETTGKAVRTVYAVARGERENDAIIQAFGALLDVRQELKAAKGLATSQEVAQ